MSRFAGGLLVAALFFASGVLPGVASASPLVAATSPVPTALIAKAKSPAAAFGAAPASVKGPDGRAYFTFDSSPGAPVVDHIAVTNYTRHPERLQVYAVDATPGSKGSIAFGGPTVKAVQAGSWVAVGTPHGSGSITVQPRSIDVLPIHGFIPNNVTPGDHVGAVIVSLTGFAEGKFGQGGVQKVKFDQRLAVKTIFHISGPSRPHLTIGSLKTTYDGPIDPFAKGTATVTYTVHNSGNLILGGPQTVTVHGLFGEHVTAGSVASIPGLLPGATYPVTVKVQNVYPETRMSAKISIAEQALPTEDAQGLVVVTSSVHFWAIPWILLIVLVLLILGLALAVWRHRWRRRPPVQAGRVPAKPAAQGVTA